jgi:lysophospholipase L1-like esterase
MRVLVISDSHGRKMAEVLERKKTNWNVLTLSLGRKIPAIRRLYQSKLRAIRRFRPDIVVMHLGHNDLVLHHLHNMDPNFITTVLADLYAFAGRVASDLPRSRIYLSSMFPRVEAEWFDESMVGKYNRMARRFGERLRSQSNQIGSVFHAIINRKLWGRIARWETLPGNHKIDGLHLCREGRDVVGDGWIKAILNE